MKKSLFTLALLATLVSVGTAQEFSIGPFVGINHSWIADAPGTTEGINGLNAGVALVYSTEEHWGVGLDLKYSGEGMITKQRGITAKTRLDYVRVPLKFIYFFNKFGDDFRPKIYAGPSVGILAGGRTEQITELGTYKVDSKDLYEGFDFGAVVGTGFNYRIARGTWLNFDVAYGHGFTNIAKSGKGYNRSALLSLGVAWGI